MQVFGNVFRRLTIALTFVLVLGSCSQPSMDCKTAAGKQAILDTVNIALSEGDCATAVDKIESVYNSSCTDTDVRMARASAQACTANINFFKLLTELASSTLTGGGLFVSAAKNFPSTTSDSRAEAAWNAQDALMSITKSGVVIPPAAQLNATGSNPGSLRAIDRTDEANVYLIFAALAAMGASENRYSSPNSTTYHKGNVLGYTTSAPAGWATAANMTLEGCAYAASVLTFFDAIGQVATSFSTALATKFSTLSSSYSSILDVACAAGCTTCGGTVSCSSCPTELRNRYACTLSNTDKYTCAAAGIINFINTDATLGWP